jgi:hypothetical protein
MGPTLVRALKVPLLPSKLIFASASTTLIPAETWCDTPDPIPQASSDVSSGALRAVSIDDKMWMPYETVTYGFMDGVDAQSEPTEYRKQRVHNALARYMAHTSLIFKEVDIKGRDFNDKAERQRCVIRIAFGPLTPIQGGVGLVRLGWSCIGKEAKEYAFNGQGGRPGPLWATLWLGGQALLNDAELKPMLLLGTNQAVWHELGHALGLKHEHESPNTEIKGGKPLAGSTATLVRQLSLTSRPS